MLKVDYTNPIGYVTRKTTNGNNVKLHLCTINDKCWAEIHSFVNETNVREHQLCMFFCNEEHIKNCAQSHIDLKDCHYHFNAWNMGSHVNNTIFKCLLQMGAKVSLYYKEYKKQVII